MMRHILAPVTGDAGGATSALCALRLGRLLNAHVTAAFANTAAAGQVKMFAADERSREGRRRCARRDFDAAVAEIKLPIATRPLCAQATTEWLDGVAGDGDPVGDVAPLADLVVLPAPGSRRSSGWDMIESVIFAARRPALVVPPGCADISMARPVIAWNGSLQAANAVRAALDLFSSESRITILQVGELCAGGISAARLADTLGWHCFEASKVEAADAPHATGATILEQAKRLEASVLVMGAYGHSRTRELILGGVTDYLLSTTSIPLLISH